MTINKAQGQTLERVGIDLRKEVFGHGQLYVALSRARSWNMIKVKLDDSNSDRKIKNKRTPEAHSLMARRLKIKAHAVLLERNTVYSRDVANTEVQSIRDLGILIDNKLKFTEHISNIIKSAYYRMRLLFKYLKTRSIKIWKSVYTSYIRSLLEYSTVNWSPNSKKDINRLEKCQKFYTKIALKKCRLPYIRYQNRLTLFELPTLENRRKILDLVTIYKIINGYTCLDPKSLFNFSERSSSRHRDACRAAPNLACVICTRRFNTPMGLGVHQRMHAAENVREANFRCRMDAQFHRLGAAIRESPEQLID
uniref:C2H2-type domain-containing protein n=1 Tax=Meloidogyne hapla TaxID=6305 RepID=A0A1I8B891_MELHA